MYADTRLVHYREDAKEPRHAGIQSIVLPIWFSLYHDSLRYTSGPLQADIFTTTVPPVTCSTMRNLVFF